MRRFCWRGHERCYIDANQGPTVLRCGSTPEEETSRLKQHILFSHKTAWEPED